MKCEHPTIGWRIGQRYTKDGILSPHITFSEREAIQYFSATGMLPYIDSYAMPFPCGHCAACLINKRKQWSTKLVHEMSCFEQCCFITLTYNDDSIPTTSLHCWDDSRKSFQFGLKGSGDAATLMVGDVQRFVKRLRRHLEYYPKTPSKRIGRDYVPSKIRYFVVGEYGPKTRRPHYHIVIFGWSPSDVKPYFRSASGQQVYRSAQVEQLWPFGFSTIEACGIGTAKYVSQYVTKKFSKPPTPLDDYIVPEFFRYSTRGGGIGTSWLKKWYRECLRVDRPFVTYRHGKNIVKAAIPASYRRWIRKNKVADYLLWRGKMVSYIQELRLSGKSAAIDWEAQRRAIVKDIHDQQTFFAKQNL